MRRTSLLVLTTIFSFLGILDSWYLAQHALTNTALYCGIGALSGCNAVAQSPYSHLFGIPLGVYGVFFYGVVFIASALAYSAPVRRLMQLLFLFGCLGFLMSLYFIGLQLFVIDAICIYCVASFALSVGIFVTTFKLVRHRPAPLHAMT